jgi:hypothetical protein
MKQGWLLIPCRHAHELLSERMDEPLGPGDRVRLWLHLRICDMCARVEQQMDFMRKAMRRLGE